MAMEFKAGDWNCSACGDHQFERNTHCRKCGTPKMVAEGLSSSNGITGKAGDWMCPNPRCGDLQFERNVVCRKCGTPKPGMGKGSGFGGMGGKGKGYGKNGGMDDMGTMMMKAMQTVVSNMMGVSGTGKGGMMKGGLPQDWKCIQCGDLQFAKNTQCRKCGAPKPPAFPNGQMPKPGDWICPNPQCGDVQFERNAQCRKCGTHKPEDAVAVTGAVKRGPPPLVSRGDPDAKRARGNTIEPKDGDWICPNEACKDVQFERNKVCRRCGTPKPGEDGASASGQDPAARPEDWNCPECDDLQFGRNLQCRKCGCPRPKVATNNIASKKGDWICPNKNCQDVQFERNNQCRRCGTPKPGVSIGGGKGGGIGGIQNGMQQQMMNVMQQMMGMAGMSVAQQMGNNMMGQHLTQMSKMKPGDWICPNSACGDLQFSKNSECRKCGTPKPTMSSNGQVMKPGDWLCPNPECGDVQFEKNTVCRKCSTPKPQ